jgi:hypothetical protein
MTRLGFHSTYRRTACSVVVARTRPHDWLTKPDEFKCWLSTKPMVPESHGRSDKAAPPQQPGRLCLTFYGNACEPQAARFVGHQPARRRQHFDDALLETLKRLIANRMSGGGEGLDPDDLGRVTDGTPSPRGLPLAASVDCPSSPRSSRNCSDDSMPSVAAERPHCRIQPPRTS